MRSPYNKFDLRQQEIDLLILQLVKSEDKILQSKLTAEEISIDIDNMNLNINKLQEQITRIQIEKEAITFMLLKYHIGLTVAKIQRDIQHNKIVIEMGLSEDERT